MPPSAHPPTPPAPQSPPHLTHTVVPPPATPLHAPDGKPLPHPPATPLHAPDGNSHPHPPATPLHAPDGNSHPHPPATPLHAPDGPGTSVAAAAGLAGDGSGTKPPGKEYEKEKEDKTALLKWMNEARLHRHADPA